LEGEVLPTGGLAVGAVLLPDDADDTADAHRIGDDVAACDASAAGIRPRERREDLDRRRLAGAVGAE
jgi:hypothetical protein